MQNKIIIEEIKRKAKSQKEDQKNLWIYEQLAKQNHKGKDHELKIPQSSESSLGKNGVDNGGDYGEVSCSDSDDSELYVD